MIHNKNILFFLLQLLLISFSISFAQNDEDTWLKKYNWLRERMPEKSRLSLNELKDMLKTSDSLIEHYREKNKKKVAAEIYLLSSQIEEEILKRQGEEITDKVIRRLCNGVDLDPDNNNLRRELVIALKKQGKSEEAKRQLKLLIAINPQDTSAIKTLIDIFIEKGQIDSTFKWYPIYLRLRPNDINSWIKFIDIQLARMNSSDSANAVKSLQMAIDTNPNSSRLRLKLAKLYETQHKWKDVIEQCKKIDPQNEETIRLINEATSNQTIQQLIAEGKYLLDGNDKASWEKSRNIFDSILYKYPQNKDALLYRSQAKQKLFEYCFREAQNKNIREKWKEAYDYSTMAIIYADSERDKHRAFDELKRAAIGQNKQLEAKNAQEAAKLALESGDFKRARNKYILVIELTETISKEITQGLIKTDVGQNYNWGLAALNKGEYANAKTYFGKVKEIDPTYDEVDSYYNRADSMLCREILVRELNLMYKDEMNHERWKVAYGLLKKLIVIDTSPKVHEDLKLAEKKMNSELLKNNQNIMTLLLLIVFLFVSYFIFNNIKLKENSLERKKIDEKINEDKRLKEKIEKIRQELLDKSATLRFYRAGIPFFIIYMLLMILLSCKFAEGNNFIKKIVDFWPLFAAGVPVSFLFLWFIEGKNRFRILLRDFPFLPKRITGD